MMRREALRLIQAMNTELHRSMDRLRAPGHPRPYFISYLIRDIESFSTWARYGSLYQDRREHKRVCYADVRVGSYRYDNTSKGGLPDSKDEDLESAVELSELPIENDIDSFRFSLWRLTDAKFRDAVARFHGKKSRDVSFLDQNRGLPSFQKLKADRAMQTLRPFKIATQDWNEYVRKASLVFKKYPQIKNSYVEFTCDLVSKIYVSSEGVERVWQEPLYSLSAYFWFHTENLDQDYNIVHHVRDINELPDLNAFKQGIKDKLAQFIEVEAGDELSSYAGPVLLAPKAAGLFLHEVVGHRLEGSRLLSESEGRTFRDKLNQKIMHHDLSLSDDPSIAKIGHRSLVAHYPFDDEGAVAQRANLVERGVLKGFLTTRSPIRKKAHVSNGHARNNADERPISRMANLIVESHSQHSWDDLKRMLIAELIRRKLAFGIILLDVEGGETETEAYNFQAFLGQIAVAVKVYPSGRERYMRGVDFVGTPLSSLAHIMAVGRDLSVDNGFCGAESGTIPVSTVAPAMLLSNLELQAKNPSKATQYAMPLPWFDK